MILILFGPQGSGKGTIASRVGAKLGGIPHISTGDMLRDEVKRATEIGKNAAPIMNSGGLVPDAVVNKLLEDRLSKDDAKNGFILDGYPRNITQAHELETKYKVDAAVLLNVPVWLLLSRLTNRRVCRNCGEVYNLVNLNPKKEGVCDKCGGEVYQRDDDKEEAIKERFATYERVTMPLVEYYKGKGILKTVTCDKLETTPDENVASMLKALGIGG